MRFTFDDSCVKDFILAEKLRKIDKQMAQISARQIAAKTKLKKTEILPLRSLLIKVVTDILAFMALGVLLGYYLNKKFNIAGGRLCFLICTIIACLACVKNITKIK